MRENSIEDIGGDDGTLNIGILATQSDTTGGANPEPLAGHKEVAQNKIAGIESDLGAEVRESDTLTGERSGGTGDRDKREQAHEEVHIAQHEVPARRLQGHRRMRPGLFAAALHHKESAFHALGQAECMQAGTQRIERGRGLPAFRALSV